ncbi:MAG TPA: B12-binding domain-containing radical SAM protein, partial [bacterium]|nr:B12-binding domain-containing radical SAM protein [bacterium]
MKKKILFLQPPTPLVNFDLIYENTQTAAGYLTAYILSQNNFKNYDFIIADTLMNDYFGDELIIKKILELSPEYLCFSCYCWNIARIKNITEKIKKLDSSIKIIYGGPEITEDNNFLLNNNFADILVRGEGELTFENLVANDFNIENINSGILKKTSENTYYYTGANKKQYDIKNQASPYLLNILKPEKSGFMRFETMRGCPKKCSYCYYSKEFSKVRFLSLDIIEKLYIYALKNEATEIFLLDPDFLAHKNIKEVLEIFIKNRRKYGKNIEIHTELNVLHSNLEISKLLCAANFKSVEIGFQSCNIEKLKLSNRHQDIKKFLEGVKNLRDNNIDMIIDIIIGLPGETIDDIRRTFDFIVSHNLQKEAQVFNLAVLPGTALRENAHKFDIQYSYYPPYYMKSSNTLTTENLANLFIEAEDLFGIEFDPIELPSFIEKNQNSDNADFYTKCIINCSNIKPNSLKKILDEIPQKITNNFSLWLKNYRPFIIDDLLKKIICEIPKKNQNTVFDFIIELENVCDFRGLIDLFSDEQINFNHYLNHYYIFDFGEEVAISSKKILIYPLDNSQF